MSSESRSSTDESRGGSADASVFVVVHYHEIALKGRNRPHFVARLVKNIEEALSDLAVPRVMPLPGRLLVELSDPGDWPIVRERLAHVMGIANYAPVHRVELDIDAIADAVARSVEGRRFESFRIATRRANKKFPLNSMEIDRLVGQRVQSRTGAPVSLHAPELTVFIEILPREALFFFAKSPGSRGVPVGTGGRAAALLSGGIDSPVAAYRMLKRGCRLTLIHFHSAPFLSRASQQKAKDLTQLLTRHQNRSILYLVGFGELQRQIMLSAPAALRVILYRRFMMRIAGHLAFRRHAKALVTGESLGQVASQTLENLSVIEQAAGLPVLRPLIGMDKEEIIEQAKAIGTYDISILPEQDCCQLFIPAHPATRCRLWEVEAVEEKMDVEEMVRETVRDVEQMEFSFPRVRSRVSSNPEDP